MSNRVCIQRCEFIDYPYRRVTYGFRAYDDYDQTYLNTASPDQLAMDPLEFLKWLKQNIDDDRLGEMFAFIEENEGGLYIDDSWYDWDTIRHIFTDGPRTEPDRAGEIGQSPTPQEGA